MGDTPHKAQGNLTVTGSGGQRSPPPPSTPLMNLREEEAIRWRGREAGVGGGRGDADGARRADGRAVNPRCLIALWGMASCQQR